MALLTEKITIKRPIYSDPPRELPERYEDIEQVGAGRIDRRSDIAVEDELNQIQFTTTFRIRDFQSIRNIAPGWYIVDWHGNEYRIESVRRQGGFQVSQARAGIIFLDCLLSEGAAD